MRDTADMGIHLVIGSFNGGNWRLPAETSARDLRAELVAAIETGTTVPVVVEMNNDPNQRTTLYVNGRCVDQFVVLETDDEGRVVS